MGITLNMVPLSFRKMKWDFQGLWPLLQWDAGFKCIYSFQQASFKHQGCAGNFLPWQNVMGKLVVKTKELLMRDPFNQQCWCLPEEVGPAQSPETWLDRDLILHHHVGSEWGPAITDPAIGCAQMAHCVYPLSRAPSTEPADPLPKAASLSFPREQQPNLDLSSPLGPPLTGLVPASCTPLKAIGIIPWIKNSQRLHWKPHGRYP